MTNEPEPRVRRTLRLPAFLDKQIREFADLAEVSENQMTLCMVMQGLIADGEVLSHLTRDEYDHVTDQVGQGTCDEDLWEWACNLSKKRAEAGEAATWTPVIRAEHLVVSAAQVDAELNNPGVKLREVRLHILREGEPAPV